MDRALKNKLAATTALVVALFGYSRRSYAACVLTSGTSYLCSGANATTQAINVNEALVSTASGFSVNTAAGNAITITGDGALSFTDSYASTITTTAAAVGLSISSVADDGGTPGSVTINTNSNITGYNGINVHNFGTGATTITSNGNVTAGGGFGLYARNYGTALTITTGVSSSVTGGNNGILARNNGSGYLSIMANGTVTGTNTDGIYAYNKSPATNLTITTGTSSNVTGGTNGIFINNHGTGATTITANGAVTGTSGFGIFANNLGSSYLSITANGTVTGTSDGIRARNYGTDLTLTTGVGSNIAGTISTGIYARNFGTGALTITANGDVTGGNTGIYAHNSGTDLSVTTGVGTTITGTSNYGIHAVNYGIGALAITANGDVTGGIDAINNGTGTDLSVTTGAGTVITGTGFNGIGASNSGSGALTITANGDVTGGNTGIVASNTGSGTDLSITTGVGTTITGTSYNGINASNSGTGALSITADGDVTGGRHGIFAFNRGTGALSITNSGTITGNTGILVNYNGSSAGGITNNASGTIQGTGGIAISLTHLTASLPITIDGGHIIGDVVDDTPANGFSPVTVAFDFTTQGNFNVSSFSINSGATFTFGAGKTVSSFSEIQDSGTMAVASPGSSITGDLHVNSGGVLTVGDDFTDNGALRNDGTVSVASGKILTAATMAAGAGTLTFGVTSAANHGEIVISSGAAILTGETITVDVANGNTLANSDKLLIVDGTANIVGGPGGTPVAVADNSPQWKFEIVDGTGSGVGGADATQLYLEAMPAFDLSAATSGNNRQAGQTLLSVSGTTNPVLQEIIANLGNAATNGAANHVLESVQPTVDGSGQTAALDVSDHVLGLTGERLASLRDGSDGGVTGMSAGDAYGNDVERIEPAGGKDNDSASLLKQAKPMVPPAAATATTQSQTYAAPPPAVDYSRRIPATKMWAEAFGQHSNQGERDSIAGYSASTWGGAAGMDTRNIADNMVAGVAVSYGRTDANSQNANSTDTNVDSYQVTLYGDYSPPGGSYVDGMLAYGWNHDDTTRHDVGGITGLTAHGSYDANQVTAQAEAGREYREGNTILTPDIMAHGVWYNPASYTETGAGGADLHVDGSSQSLFELGAGLKAGWVLKCENGGVLKPQVRAGYRYALVDSKVEDTSQFTGGGGTFTAQGPDPARSNVNLGATLKYLTTTNWNFTASYDFNWKSDYTSNAGFVRAGYRF